MMSQATQREQVTVQNLANKIQKMDMEKKEKNIGAKQNKNHENF